MEQQFLLQDLNPAQCEAVGAPRGNYMIVAGAGTGKTKVLVSRIAWLMSIEQVRAAEILAVTFTNKAARQMRERVGAIIGAEELGALWCNTFHSICVRLLSTYATEAGLSRNFTILDNDDSHKLIKAILEGLVREGTISDTDRKALTPREIYTHISRFKDRAERAAYVELNHTRLLGRDSNGSLIALVYRRYEEACNRDNLVDFDELLLRTVELLENNEGVRRRLNSRFTEILVDEFQDTNTLQYRFLRLIAGPKSHVTVVGDDDQSIYSWRGADFRNLKRFLEDFADAKLLKLEDNYRSSQNILDFANALIVNNESRVSDKLLRGTLGTGPEVSVLESCDQLNEARQIVDYIVALHDSGKRYADMAILYRNNNLSINFEKELGRRGINYVIYGGLKFFEREEVKNALAWLHLLINAGDDVALLRIINVPSRKIGPAVINKLRDIAQERGCALLAAIELVIAEAAATKSSPVRSLATRLTPFWELLGKLRKLRQECTLPELIEELLQVTGLLDYYKEKDEKESHGAFEGGRVGNLGELVSQAALFIEEREQEPESARENMDDDPLVDFLAGTSLRSGTELDALGGDHGDQSTVQLMTIHAAKGLEFKYEFLTGFESEILPSTRGDGHADRLEEERRLAYVGITRARIKLFISYALNRVIYGETRHTGASPFFAEIVSNLAGTASGGKGVYNLHRESRYMNWYGSTGYGSYGRSRRKRWQEW